MRIQKIFAVSIGLTLVFAFILGGSVLSMRASKSEAHSVPPFVDGAIPSSAVCTDFVLDLGLIDIDIPDPGWVLVNAGNPGQPQFRSVSGLVTKSKVTHTDFPAVHDSHDQNTDILVDPGYESILSDAGKDENGDGTPDTLELEWEIGTFPSETGSDPERTFPKWAWPNEGDRVWADGNWIFDCGHPTDIEGVPHARTEIHPARAIASMRDQMRTLPGTGATPVEVTATDLYIHGRGGFVGDILACGMDIIVNGGACTPYPHTASPIAENFEFDVCTPPLPFDKAVLATFVEDGPGNSVTDSALAPELEVVPSTGACTGPGFGPSQVHVTIPLGGSSVTPDDVYARKIYAGYVFPPEDLRHLKLTLNLMDLHEDHEVDPGDCECTFFWMNVDKAPENEWIRMSTYATGDMNDYDDDQGLGDGEMGFSGAAFDFYVADGQSFNVRANGYDQDCLDDHFGEPHSFDSVTFLDCYFLAAFELNAGDNDEFNSLLASFGPPGYGVGAQDVSAGGEYELEFTIDDLPLAAGEDSADLFLTKDCKPDEGALAGKQFTCTILVQNPTGPGLPRNVVVHDTMLTDVDPSDYTLEPPTFSFGGLGGLTDPCEPVEDIPGGKEFKCNVGTVPIGGKAIVTMKITSNEGGDFNNYADVASESADADLTNNTGHDSVHVTPVADLSITKTDSPDPLDNGTALTYTLEVTNNGPSTAVNVVVEDILPAGVSIVSVGATGPSSCVFGVPGDPSRPTTCTFDSIAPSDSETMTIQVTVNPGVLNVAHNDARVGSDTLDLNNSNDLASADTTIEVADLKIQKSSDRDLFKPSTTVRYTISVMNNGPADAQNVVVVDTLPNATDDKIGYWVLDTGYLYDPDGCELSGDGTTLTCEFGTLPAGASLQFEVYFHVVGNKGLVTNTVTVSSTTFDPVAANNTALRSNLVQGKDTGKK